MIRMFVALLFLIVASDVLAQGLKVKAEAEGKLMMYATFTAADSKTLLDGFRQIYPKIDALYYRSNDDCADGAIRQRKPRWPKPLRCDHYDEFLR
jgi:hypothetical protein